MKVCPKCGRTYDSGNASFCPVCGVQLTDGGGAQKAGSGAHADASVPAGGIPGSASTSFDAPNPAFTAMFSSPAGNLASAIAGGADSLKRIAFIVGIVAAIIALFPIGTLCIDSSSIAETADGIDDIRMSVNSSYHESSAVNLRWGNPGIGDLASYINQSDGDYRHLGAAGSSVDVSGFNGIEQTLTILTVLSIAGSVLYLISVKLHNSTLRLIGAAVVAVAALVAVISTAQANGSIVHCLKALSSQLSSLNRSEYASQVGGYANKTYISQPFTSWLALLGIVFSEGTMIYLRKSGQDA